jgi:Bacterial PH domain
MDLVKALNNSGLLQQGETATAAVTVQPGGSVKRQAGLAVGGAIGGALASAVRSGSVAGGDGVANQFTALRGLVVLTNQRLVFCKTGGLTAKPKEVVGALDLAQVDRIVHERKRGVHSLELWCADGSEVTFDAMGGGNAASVAAKFAEQR